MNLDADIRAEMLKYLPAPDRETGSLLADMPTGRLLDCFLNWRDRLAHPHPRALRISAELPSHPRFKAMERDIRRIWQKTTEGADLARHMGRGVRFAYLQTPQRPRDLNILLNNWDIHWLNVSDRIEKDGFAQRSDTLLFVIFKEDAAYFLDLMPRARWHGRRLVEIALRNWPDDGLFNKLPSGAAPPAEKVSVGKARNRARSARNGSEQYLTVDGDTYISNSFGVAAGSSPARITVMSMKLQGLLQFYAENPAGLEREFKAANERFNITWPLLLQFHLIVARTARAYEFVILENTTAAMMSLGV
jgi:hypothetical protein